MRGAADAALPRVRASSPIDTGLPTQAAMNNFPSQFRSGAGPTTDVMELRSGEILQGSYLGTDNDFIRFSTREALLIINVNLVTTVIAVEGLAGLVLSGRHRPRSSIE